MHLAKKMETTRKARPALTPEAKESQLIALATDLAEKKLRDGTANTQIITHYLKLATVKYNRELEKLEKENEMLRAKTEAIESSQRVEELYTQALDAMRSYSGMGDDTSYD